MPGGIQVAKKSRKGLNAITGSIDLLLGSQLVAVVEHALVGRGRQVGRVRVHVAQEEEEGLVFARQPVQLGDGHLVQVLRLGAAALVPAAPAGEVEVGVEAARGWDCP